MTPHTNTTIELRTIGFDVFNGKDVVWLSDPCEYMKPNEIMPPPMLYLFYIKIQLSIILISKVLINNN